MRSFIGSFINNKSKPSPWKHKLWGLLGLVDDSFFSSLTTEISLWTTALQRWNLWKCRVSPYISRYLFAVPRYIWSNVKRSSETVFQQLSHDEGQHTRDVGKSSAERRRPALLWVPSSPVLNFHLEQLVWDLSCTVATNPVLWSQTYCLFFSHNIPLIPFMLHFNRQPAVSSTIPGNIIEQEHSWVCCLVCTESEQGKNPPIPTNFREPPHSVGVCFSVPFQSDFMIREYHNWRKQPIYLLYTVYTYIIYTYYIYIYIRTVHPKETTSPFEKIACQTTRSPTFQHLPTILKFGAAQGPSGAEHGHDDLPVKSPPHVGQVDAPESLCRHAGFPGEETGSFIPHVFFG